MTRAAISVCALLRHDARARAHLTSVVVSGGVYPFARGFIAAQCALITADASCEGDGGTRETNCEYGSLPSLFISRPRGDT